VKYPFILLICLVTYHSLARDVVVVFPENIPPWVNSEENKGIAVEIVKQSLAYSKHNLVPMYVPFSRMEKAFNKTETDAVAMVEGNKILGPYYYSDVTTKFRTSLISLSKNKIKINTFDDLNNKHILAFLDAKKVFTELAKLAKLNDSYKEISNQESQVALLFKERVDLIIIDRNIFYFWRNSLTNVDTSRVLTFHDLSAISKIQVESPTQTVFKDKQPKKQFNDGLRQLKDSGTFQAIINKNLKSDQLSSVNSEL